MTSTDIGRVAGVVDTLLTRELLDRLPENTVSAPWVSESEAVFWTSRGGPAATAALAPCVSNGATALNVVGGMVRYIDTPVGSYDEVLGSIGFRRGCSIRGSVAFMAVDSEASLVGGRTNWGMPKTLATFSGAIGAGSTMRAANAIGTSWQIAATPRVIGPTVPISTSFTVIQQFGDGTVRASELRAKGRARPALVAVEVESRTGLPGWLRPGRHFGVVVEEMTLTLDEPFDV